MKHLTPHATLIECAGWFRGTLLDTPSLRVDAFCEPLDGHCGDSIGLYRPSPSVVLGVIADACGHGAEAAALLKAAAEPSIDVPLSGRSPAELLEAFGAGVAGTGGAVEGKFITAMVFTLDIQSGVLTVALAGHPPPALVQQGKLIARSWPAGLPIGVHSRIGAEDITIQLSPGDAVVAFTDGVADARAVSDKNLGFEGSRVMLGHAARATDPVAAALRALGADQQRDWQADDTTAMFIRFGDVEHTSGTGRDEAWMPR